MASNLDGLRLEPATVNLEGARLGAKFIAGEIAKRVPQPESAHV